MIDFSISGVNVSPPSYEDANKPSSKASEKRPINPENKDKNEDKNQSKKANSGQNPDELSFEEIQELSKLKQRDREVKAHEQAHISAGGQYVRSGARYEYEKGPDGRNYAVGGEVSIDTSKVPGDPEATARKMQVIRRAAMGARFTIGSRPQSRSQSHPNRESYAYGNSIEAVRGERIL